MVKGRDCLLYMSIKYNGDWDKIFHAMQEKEKVDFDQFEKYKADLKCKYITILDEDYPDILKQINKPPFVLFYYGDINLLKTRKICVVGSRKYSDYGKRQCEYFIDKIASEATVVSGLASGIDSIAHQACINAGGKTIAVLGSGIDNCYPVSNKILYEVIKNHHLVLSEYPSLVEPDKRNFPARNRIVAGISDLTFVIEGKEKSGTLITVAYSLEQGKDVCCLPRNVDEYSVCNKLIKDGAYLVETPEDILELIN
ncbi:MAG: DNA-protecting protein DprA [Bacilli bacterium]|nr:DNA-protecting protein DprA [Bacilli bacterium]